MSRVLGIDWGSRRIGLSAGDADIGLAFPLDAATESTEKERLEHLLRLIEKDRVQTIVIGYPFHMNGDAGEMIKKVDAFISTLSELAPQVSIHRLDERLSSQAADQLSPHKKKQSPKDKIKERKSGVRDSRAATVILQDFFDQQNQQWEFTHPDDLDIG